MARKSRQDGFFRALLRLFPAEFRGDFGDQMAADFRDQRGDVAGRSGAPGLVTLWGRTAADLVRRAPQEHFDVLRRDAVHAVRILRRRPASTLTVILSLAIGIGLNAAVFSVVSGVLWRSLPFGESDRLVRILDVDAENPSRTRDNTPGNFLDLERATRAFESVAAAGRQTKTIVEPGEPEDLQTGVVSEGFFETLRAKPLLGRTFAHDDYASSIARNQQSASRHGAARASGRHHRIRVVAAQILRTSGRRRPARPHGRRLDCGDRRRHGSGDGVCESGWVDGGGVVVSASTGSHAPPRADSRRRRATRARRVALDRQRPSSP